MARDRQRAREQRRVSRQEVLIDRNEALSWNVRARRLPDELLRGGPREVVDAVRYHMPDQSLTRRGSRRRTLLVVAENRDDAVGRGDSREPRTLDRCEHLFRILQHAGATHDPPTRHVELYIESTEVVVKLRRAEVLLRIPSAQIVVHGNARKPLRRLKQ